MFARHWMIELVPTHVHYVPKSKPKCSIITLVNVDRFSKFFHQAIRKKILYVHVTTSPATCCYYLVKVENLKMLLTLTGPRQTVDMFLRTLWGLDLTFNSRQTVSRLLTLTDWLTFWSLTDDVSNQQLNLIQLNVVASWRFFHHDYFSPSSFFLVYTSYFVHICK